MGASADAPDGQLSIAIGVLTYHRTARLRVLIPQLLTHLDQAQRSGSMTRGDILVVDNDPARSAAEVVESLRHSAVRYDVEPRPGISYARNRVLDLARDHDLLVFIDDDETPHDHWLDHLLGTRARTGAAAVAGRVVSAADGELDPFVVEGGFLDRSHRIGLQTGARIDRAASNNLLVDLRWVREHGLRFDDDFALTGGEDSLFTSRLTQLGGVMVWCDEAVVTDHVPAARMTPRYMLRKSFFMANTTVFVELALRESGWARGSFRAVEAARQLVRTGQGIALLLGSTIGASLYRRARGSRALARAAGAGSALVGHRAVQYARTTSDRPSAAARRAERHPRRVRQ
jgi:succinoglycan biosynthesis protein ExoM